MSDFILVRTPISAQKSGVFMPATATSRKVVFADANFRVKKSRKTRGFRAVEKT